MTISSATKPWTHNSSAVADANKVNGNDDTIYGKVNEIVEYLNNTEGTKDALAKRLEVSINPDGTLKSGITAGNEWIDPALSPAYSSATQFTMTGDHRDIYLPYRRLRINDSLYAEVVSAAYTPDTTTVTIKGEALPDPIVKVEHGAMTPLSSQKRSLSIDTIIPIGAIVAWMPGYFTATGNGGTFTIPTSILSANSVAAANTFLNPLGWCVCDGTYLYDADSPIFDDATPDSRFLPDLTDDRFLMGGTDTGSGATTGSNVLRDHTHTFTLTAAGQSHAGNSPSVSDPGNHHHQFGVTSGGGTGLGATANSIATYAETTNAGSHTHTVSISHTHNSSGVSGSIGTGSVPASTENRPLYLSCFYIMRVK